jgi:hypothetical protein
MALTLMYLRHCNPQRLLLPLHTMTLRLTLHTPKAMRWRLVRLLIVPTPSLYEILAIVYCAGEVLRLREPTTRCIMLIRLQFGYQQWHCGPAITIRYRDV